MVQRHHNTDSDQELMNEDKVKDEDRHVMTISQVSYLENGQ